MIRVKRDQHRTRPAPDMYSAAAGVYWTIPSARACANPRNAAFNVSDDVMFTAASA